MSEESDILTSESPKTSQAICAEKRELDSLMKNLSSYIKSEKSFERIQHAYEYAARKHSKQFRRSGEPYITHPLAVANILTGLRADIASIIAAILHDVVEDTDCTIEEIKTEFGPVVAGLVDGLTKIGKIKFRSSQERMAENFRKMILAMSNDLRVIVIKLADRLHNMRTLGALPQEKKLRIAAETQEIYAPLANRLGIYGIKSELEDLCLKQTKLEVYREISQKIASKKTERETYINDVIKILEQELEKYGFQNAVVSGRPKHFFSIFKKMKDRQLAFEDVHDLFAFRIIVDSVKDCYEALGVVHAMWKPMPGRFKDYLAMPKPNMYQSLHTTVIRPNGSPAEIQIRTKEMHKICEMGVAAHWAYKEGGPNSKNGTDLDQFTWLRQMMEWRSELTDPEEFMEAIKVDLFEEEIFIFTPKGDVIQLPTGACPLDFAFSVHTDIGIRTVGAKVNGKMVPLRRTLQSGDIVEIQTSQNQTPNKDWLNFVKTSKARNKIRSFLRTEQRESSKKIGQELLELALTTAKIDISKSPSDRESLVKAAKEARLEDVYIAVGYGKINAEELVARTFPDKPAIKDSESSYTAPEPSSARSKESTKGVLVSGLSDVLMSFGKCCNPLPGEAIIGFVTRGRGVTVHKANCSKALDLDPRRRIEVSWPNSKKTTKSHITYLQVITQDRQGVLAEVTSAISCCGVDIKEARIRLSQEATGILDFELSLNSLEQLQQVIAKLESIPGVLVVERINARHMPRTARKGDKNEK